jgi:Fe-S cluster biogenesis protein NfuA
MFSEHQNTALHLTLNTQHLTLNPGLKTVPKIAEIEPTPNPNAMKFILKEPLTWGITRSYDNAGLAQEDPLAAALFDIEHVTNVFYVDHWITVTQDGQADWQALLRDLAVPIREAPAADETSASLAAESAAPALENLSDADRERLDRINEVLDEQIRPYLQGDGGDLYVIGLEGNRLTVHYQGACGSCPSSLSGTLAGIESLVRQLEPDMEVVAV